MTKKLAFQLQADQKINHTRYGPCTVHSVIAHIGVVIMPDTKKGKDLLIRKSGVENSRLVEDHFRLMQL